MPQAIIEQLKQVFQPLWLEVTDESAAHQGHEGYRRGTTTHVKIVIVAAVFEGLSRVERHRLVYTALQKETGLHAIAIKAFTLLEYGNPSL